MKHLSQHHRGFFRRLWWLIALVVILMTVYVVACRQVMRVLPQWQNEIVSMLEAQTGVAFSVGSLSGHMEGLTPVFELHQVTLPSASDKTANALSINHIVLSPDILMSLLHQSLWLRKLSIAGLSMTLVQNADGHLQLAGFPRQSHQQSANLRAVLDLLYQQKLVILDNVHLSLQLNDMPVIETQDARLEMQSSGEQHQLAIQVQTDRKPVSLDVRVQLNNNAYDLTDIDGTVYIAMQGDDVGYWLPDSLATSLQVKQLSGKLAFWLTLRKGKLEDASLALNIQQLELADAEHHWQASNVVGLVRVRRQDGYQIQVQGLDFDTSGGHWHSGTLAGWWNGEKGEQARWKVLLTQLDLQQLGGQLLRWPFALPDSLVPLQKKLAAFRPHGHLAAVYLSGLEKQITHFSGRFYQVGFQAVKRLPGIAGLSGWFDGTPQQGAAVITASQLAIDYPHFYDHVLKGTLAGGLRWHRDEAGLTQIETGVLRGGNANGQGKLVMGVTLRPNKRALIHLLAHVTQGKVARAATYIPGERLPQGLATWLKAAFIGGKVKSADFLVEGKGHINPEREQDHTFQMQFAVTNTDFHFMKGWPNIHDLAGTLTVDGRHTFGQGFSGRIYDSHFTQAGFDVNQATPGAPVVLKVNGNVAANAKDLGRLLQQTPLATQLPNELGDWQLNQGTLQGNLALTLALGKTATAPPAVKVMADLSGVELQNKKRQLTFSQLAGQVQFDLQQGVEASALSGRWLGNALTANIHTRNHQLTINAQGDIQIQPLRQWLDGDWLAPLTGHAKSHLSLTLPWHSSSQPVVMALRSNLDGAGVALPYPLGKKSQSERLLTVRLQAGKQVNFQYGKSPRVTGRLALTANGLKGGVVQLGRGDNLIAKRDGVLVKGHLAHLNAKDWVDVIAHKNPTATTNSHLPPLHLSLHVDTLDLYGYSVHNAAVSIVPSPQQGWQLVLASRQLAGQLTIPPDYQARGKAPLEIAIDHLTFESSRFAGDNKMPSLSPLDLPVADVDIRHLTVNGIDQGDWHGNLRPTPHGIQVKGLQGSWGHANFDGVLGWKVRADGQVSYYQGQLGSHDLKDLQQEWGITPVIVGNQANVTANVTWPGSPLEVDYRQLDGHATLAIGACRLPHLDKNNPVLRLIGLLNVGSITRRLQLDFSDLYRDGLSCDSIDGDLTFNQQHLVVNKMRLKSPSVNVRFTGNVNLKTGELDNNVTVILPFSSNLYVGCLAGPAACAGIFVFDQLFGSKLEKAAALHYHVGGTWDDPIVKKQ